MSGIRLLRSGPTGLEAELRGRRQTGTRLHVESKFDQVLTERPAHLVRRTAGSRCADRTRARPIGGNSDGPDRANASTAFTRRFTPAIEPSSWSGPITLNRPSPDTRSGIRHARHSRRRRRQRWRSPGNRSTFTCSHHRHRDRRRQRLAASSTPLVGGQPSPRQPTACQYDRPRIQSARTASAAPGPRPPGASASFRTPNAAVGRVRHRGESARCRAVVAVAPLPTVVSPSAGRRGRPRR
jgi:hypothetical protein